MALSSHRRSQIRGDTEENAIVLKEVADRTTGLYIGLALLEAWFQTLNVAWRPQGIFVGPDIGPDQKPGLPRKKTFGEVLRDIMGKHTVQITLPEPGSQQATIFRLDTQTKLLKSAEVLMSLRPSPRAEIYPALGTVEHLTESTIEPTVFTSNLRRFKFFVDAEIGTGEKVVYWFDVRYRAQEK